MQPNLKTSALLDLLQAHLAAYAKAGSALPARDADTIAALILACAAEVADLERRAYPPPQAPAQHITDNIIPFDPTRKN